MATIGDLVVNLGMNTAMFNSGIGSSLRGVNTLSKGVSSSIGAIKGALAPLAPLFAAVGAAMGFASAINGARDAVAQQRKLEAVLKATGGAAGLTSGEIMGLANDMSNLTNFEDDAITGAAGVLATFKEIKGDQFKNAMGAAADMSAVLGGDLQGSVMQIGKALNDPTKGITALTRAGVSFTEQQKNQIKTLQASGDMIGAQKLILGELKSEFGGAAEAMADPFIRMQNVIGNVGETIGALLLPSFNVISQAVSDVFMPLANAGDLFGSLGEQIGSITSTVIQPFVEIFRTGIEWIVAGFGMLSPVIDGVMELVITLKVAFTEAFTVLYQQITAVITEFLPGLSGSFAETGNFLGDVIRGIAFFFRNASELSQIAMLDLLIFIMEQFPEMEGVFVSVGAVMVGVFDGSAAAAGAFVSNVVAGFQEIANFAKAVFDGVANAFAAMLEGKNPLAAFQDSFTQTLASQQDVQGGINQTNPVTAFMDSFDQSKQNFEQSVSSGGGLKNSLATQKEKLLGNIGQNEQKFALNLVAPDLKAPALTAPPVVAGSPTAPEGIGKSVKNEAVMAGSKEAYSAIAGFLSGGSGDSAKQQLEVTKQQLDLQTEQVEVLGEIGDTMTDIRESLAMGGASL